MVKESLELGVDAELVLSSVLVLSVEPCVNVAVKDAQSQRASVGIQITSISRGTGPWLPAFPRQEGPRNESLPGRDQL